MAKNRKPGPMNTQPNSGAAKHQASPMRSSPSKTLKTSPRVGQPGVAGGAAEIARKGSLDKQRRLLEAISRKRTR